jgi:hypothetical protein
MKNCPHCGKPLHVNRGKGRQNIKANLKAGMAFFKQGLKPVQKTDKCDTCIYKISSVNNTKHGED